MPSFYPEGDTVLAGDGELRTLHKIASLAAGGTGNFSGSGAPSAALGSDGNSYWDTTNKDFYVKDGGTWQLLVDVV